MPFIQRILLIDDNESDNLLHSITLKRCGFHGEIHCFDGGAAALSWLQQANLNVPTIILLDINMPEMDGFAFAAAVTPLLEGSPCEIALLVTPLTADQDRERACAYSLIRHFVTKPLSTSAAKELIER